MDQVIYGFYKDRLHAVRMTTQGTADSRALLAVLRQRYGPGAQPDPPVPRYVWQARDVRLSYREDARTRGAMVWWFSRPLWAEQKADQAS